MTLAFCQAPEYGLKHFCTIHRQEIAAHDRGHGTILSVLGQNDEQVGWGQDTDHARLFHGREVLLPPLQNQVDGAG